METAEIKELVEKLEKAYGDLENVKALIIEVAKKLTD